VWIEAGVKHWHGAAQDNGMRHLVISYIKKWQELGLEGAAEQ